MHASLRHHQRLVTVQHKDITNSITVTAQLAKLAGVSDAGLDHFYKVLRVCGQWSLLDESREGRHFSANSATRQLVRGKDATLGHFVDHQVCTAKIFPTKFLLF